MTAQRAAPRDWPWKTQYLPIHFTMVSFELLLGDHKLGPPKLPHVATKDDLARPHGTSCLGVYKKAAASRLAQSPRRLAGGNTSSFGEILKGGNLPQSSPGDCGLS
jgi:hypothetical protein